MPASLEELFSKQLNNPNDLIGQQYDFLREMNRTPAMRWEYMSGKEGEYSPWENNLRISPDAINPERTLAHELQHAVRQTIGGQAYDIKKKFNPTLAEQQLLDAANKLQDTETNIPMNGLNSYRSSPSERQSYGVANSRYQTGGEYRGTPHLDSTMATEQAILFDLAKRANKSAPRAQKPVDSIDHDKNYTFKEWLNKFMSK
jgi:hypothetical protein